MPQIPVSRNPFITMIMRAQCIRTFRCGRSTIGKQPFHSRDGSTLHAVFSAPLNALSWTERAAGQFIMQKSRKGAASQLAADPEHA